MKKTIKYILILIIFLGISGAAFHAQADVPLGTCSKGPATTGDTCRANGGVWTPAPAGKCIEKQIKDPATPEEIRAGVDLMVFEGVTYKYKLVTVYNSSYEQTCREVTGGAFYSWTPIICTNSANTIPIGCTPPTPATPAVTTICRYDAAGDKSNPATATNKPCVNATDSSSSVSGPYTLLAPLPCAEGMPGCVMENGHLVLKTIVPSGPGALGSYLNIMLRILIGIAAVLAMVMIVMGGIQYMTSELPGGKEDGKSRITNAILGLILALGSYLLLNTINPDLLKTDFQITQAKISYSYTPDEQIKIYEGKEKGVCVPVADPTSACTVDKLATAGFTNNTQASSICNGESRGVAAQASTTDVCSDGKAFSYGLFQINIIAHASEVPGGVCTGVFSIDPNPPGKVGTGRYDNSLGACLAKKGNTCTRYACTVTNQAKYQSCINYLAVPANNIALAVQIQRRGSGWRQWGANNSCGF